MRIIEDNLHGEAIRALLLEHLQSMASHSPPESVHALDLEALRAPEVKFWAAWQDKALLGCGALQQLQAGHGEIKSMCTASAHRRKGVAANLLKHIMQFAQQHAYRRLSLETGSMAAFAPARALYERFGFDYCPPFADYVDDPYSVFMTRELVQVNR